MFGDLKKLLMCKLQTGSESDSLNKGQKLGNNVNVLQLWFDKVIEISIKSLYLLFYIELINKFVSATIYRSHYSYITQNIQTKHLKVFKLTATA